MEWLLLLLLVPAIVTPVVLLYGFAGCGFEVSVGPGAPADPTNVHVASKDLDHITLKWDYPDSPPEPVTFEVEINATDPPGQTFGIPNPQTPQEFSHTGLSEGKVFEFRVRAVQASDPKESNWVPTVPPRVATLSFQTAFGPITLTNNDGGNDGACTVQRIEPASLLLGGSKVRLTLRGPTAGGLTLDLITISRAAVPSDDPLNNPMPDRYDSGPDRTDVAAAIVVPVNNAVVLPPVAYQLDKERAAAHRLQHQHHGRTGDPPVCGQRPGQCGDHVFQRQHNAHPPGGDEQPRRGVRQPGPHPHRRADRRRRGDTPAMSSN
jgi:hypothetical protein